MMFGLCVFERLCATKLQVKRKYSDHLQKFAEVQNMEVVNTPNKQFPEKKAERLTFRLKTSSLQRELLRYQEMFRIG